MSCSCTRVLVHRVVTVSKSIANNTKITTMSEIQVGDTIPSVELQDGTPENTVNIADLCSEKRVIIFGVPGAFTPGCSQAHLPGYIERADEFKSKGIDEIICISVNDAFVMKAWGDSQNADDKVRMLADPNLEFVKALGLETNIDVFGGPRSKRFSMVVEDNIVTQLNVEPDGTGLSNSLAENLSV